MVFELICKSDSKIESIFELFSKNCIFIKFQKFQKNIIIRSFEKIAAIENYKRDGLCLVDEGIIQRLISLYYPNYTKSMIEKYISIVYSKEQYIPYIAVCEKFREFHGSDVKPSGRCSKTIRDSRKQDCRASDPL